MIVIQAEDNERREKNLEEAKKITIENDPSLPKPDTVSVCLFFFNDLFLDLKGTWMKRKNKNISGAYQKKQTKKQNIFHAQLNALFQ